MALQTTFNRLKREVGIKRCVILDGNVGDVYLNDKKQIVDLKQYLTDMLKGMEYDDVLYWDRIDGIDGDVSRLSVIDEVEVEGDAYSFDDDEENQPQAEEKNGKRSVQRTCRDFQYRIQKLEETKQENCFRAELGGLSLFERRAITARRERTYHNARESDKRQKNGVFVCRSKRKHDYSYYEQTCNVSDFFLSGQPRSLLSYSFKTRQRRTR